MIALIARFARRLPITVAAPLALLAVLGGGAIAQPAAAGPPDLQAHTAAVTPSDVSDSCDIAGCGDALSAYDGWQQRGFPTRRGWYNWTGGQCSYAGGEYYNNDGQLPGGDTFWEYDVYPRTCGAHRDAYRIVVDADTGQTWYSPDHYTDFYEIV